MKILRRARLYVISATICVGLCASFTACGDSTSSSKPVNMTFSSTDGSFTFDSVKNADTYLVGVSKVLNDTTGKALTSINGAVEMTRSDGSNCYIWSEQSGACTGLADNDNDGTVDGKVVFREYSSSATTVGAVISMDKLPVGYYIVQAMAASNSDITNPEAAVLEFTIGGTLAVPAGYTAQINESGNMVITAPSNFYLSCLTKTGLPEKMKFEIKEGETVVETIELDDFSYTNTVNGPNKGYTFNHNQVTGITKLDSSKTYTVEVTSVGDGEQIKDATATAYMETKTEKIAFESTIGTEGSGTCGDYTVSITLGWDTNGASVYELEATVNDVAILRESGEFKTDSSVEDIDGISTYPENAVLSFTTTKSDASTGILDGKELKVALGQSMGGWGEPQKASYKLTGEGFEINGASFEFTTASTGGFGPF